MFQIFGWIVSVAMFLHNFTGAFDADAQRLCGAELLRLKGGWARGETQQRINRLPNGREAIPNHPIAISKRPCSGPISLTYFDRFHGAGFVRRALHAASPKCRFYDPRTSVLRMGLRMDRWDSNQQFRFSPKNDTSMLLLKAAFYGADELIKPLVDAGADINYLGKRVSSLAGPHH